MKYEKEFTGLDKLHVLEFPFNWMQCKMHWQDSHVKNAWIDKSPNFLWVYRGECFLAGPAERSEAHSVDHSAKAETDLLRPFLLRNDRRGRKVTFPLSKFRAFVRAERAFQDAFQLLRK